MTDEDYEGLDPYEIMQIETWDSRRMPGIKTGQSPRIVRFEQLELPEGE